MNVSAVTSASSDASGAWQPPAAAAPAQAVAATPTVQSADLSLVIEDDKAAGELVYKTVNRATGALVSQYPNEKLVRLREESNYVPGGLIRQSA